MIRHTVSNRRKDLIAILGLLVLILAFFWKILLTNRILVGLDVFTYFYPYREYAAYVWRQGHLPLWNPYLFMGAPFLANIQSAVLYPLNIAVAWLPAPQLVNVSIALHTFLAGLFTYAFARRSLHLPPFGSFLSAVCFALGGFLGAQVEHINQLNATAWLPLLLLLMDKVWETAALYPQDIDEDQSMKDYRARPDFPARLASGLLASLVVALQVLAGHTQATYIALFGVGLYALFPPFVARFASKKSCKWNALLRTVGVRLLLLAGVVGLGSLLSAAQLLPSLELSGLSYRSGGLPYQEAVSFSLRPQLLLQSLLPPYNLDLSQVFGASFSEYVVYVSVVGLLVAVVGWAWGRHPHRHVFGLLALTGLFLGLGVFNPVYYLLYRLVPGFALFRAPVRWMLLYSLGVSLLIGYGSEALFSPDFAHRVRSTASGIYDWLKAKSTARLLIAALIPGLAFVVYFLDFPDLYTVLLWAMLLVAGLVLLTLVARQHFPRWAGQTLICLLLIGELFVASRGLAYNNPTAPQAYDFLRPAPAFLLTDPGEHRFISMSGTTYDPGDLREIEDIYGWQLPERAVYDYVVSVKRKEVLAFNLPLHFRLYVVDGYDGGLLPLERFIELQQLFLPDDRVSPDGRLREQLKEVPESRLLSLLNVKYVITDKVYDVWIDDVFYDLQFTARLGPGLAPQVSTEDILPDEATALGVISYLQDATELEDGTPVAEVLVTDDRGNQTRHVLRAGQETAEGEYGTAGAVQHAQARVGHHWRDNPHGNDYVAVFDFEEPRVIEEITVRSLIPTGEFDLRALSLIDRVTSSNRTVLLPTSGNFRLVYSGDVKIYENLDNLPRAFIVHKARVIGDDAEAIAAMRASPFQPDATVILSESPKLQGEEAAEDETVKVVTYAPEHVILDVEATGDGYLVLTDSYYPGWEARVDGEPVPIYRANLTSRAVELPAGRHQVEFEYRSHVLYLGLAISLGSLLLVMFGLVWAAVRHYKRTSNSFDETSAARYNRQ